MGPTGKLLFAIVRASRTWGSPGFLALLFLASPALSQTASPNTATATPLATSAFAELPFVENAALSPDGTHMAGLFAIEGEQHIAVMPVVGDRSKPVVVRIPDETEVSSIRWVGDDNVLIRVYALVSVAGERIYAARLIAINRKSGRILRLLPESRGQNAADVLWIPSDGSTRILVAAQDSVYDEMEFWPTVYSIDVANGNRRIVERGRVNILDWGADHLGRVRVGIGYQDNATRETLFYRSDSERVMREIERATLTQDERLTVPFHFIPDTDHGLVIKQMPDGRSALVEIDVPTGAIVRTIYDQDNVESVWLAPNSSRLLGVRTSDDTTPLRWLDPAMAANQKTLEEASPRSSVRILSVSHDLTKMLVRFGTPDNPGLLFYFDSESGDLHELAAMNKSIGPRRLSRGRMVTYKARDGLEIEGVLTMPRGRGEKNLPFIVLPHGGPWSHDTRGYHYWVQFLAERGYAVLQPNFRGSTGYGHEFEKAGEGQLGFAMQDDVTDGVRWAVDQGIADPARVCILGASYGGYAAMWGIAKDVDLYRCAVSINGVANLRRDVNDFGNDFRRLLYRDQWRRMTPDFAAVSPINAVARIETPLLLIHGQRDVTVSHAQSARMFAEMTRAGKDVEFVSIPLADHYFTREADRLTLLTSIEEFLAKHNPAD